MSHSPFQTPSFYGILDAGYVPDNLWVDKCKALIAGGAAVVQLRAKKKNSDEKRLLLEKILPLFNSTDSSLIINDDLDLCLQYDGLGLHIGQDDIAPHEARAKLGPERLLGLSTHSIEQAKNAIEQKELLNYFAVGPVFATQTKPDYIPVGLQLVSQVAALTPPLPFVCIGGITRKNAPQVLQAGAKNIVAVSDVLCDDDTAKAVREYCAMLHEKP